MIKTTLCAIALMLVACAPAPAARMSNAETPPPSSQNSATAAMPSDPSIVSRTCKVDADCEVKNVGNCCGVHPQCVNKDAPVDPQGVKAQCAREHRFGVCNVQAIGGCSCVEGKCSDINAMQMHKIP